MTQELDNKQKKEWAKLLFLTTDLTQAEIAVKIGVSRITIVRWAKEWEGLKLNFLQTREARIKSTLMQLNELDESIAARLERLDRAVDYWGHSPDLYRSLVKLHEWRRRWTPGV